MCGMEIIYCNRGSLSLILFSMRFMLCKVLNIAVSEWLVALEYQQVLGILLFSSFREIERAGQQRDAVNNDDLVMRNCDRKTRISQKRKIRITQG